MTNKKTGKGKSFSLYEPDIIDHIQRKSKSIIRIPSKKILDKFQVTPYTINNSKIIIPKKSNCGKEIKNENGDTILNVIPVAAAGYDRNNLKDIIILSIPSGAAGDTPIFSYSHYVREMADPHDHTSRKRFTDAALLDPTISPGLKDRLKSFFADGYTFGLELKSSRDDTGKILSEEEEKSQLQQYESTYLKHVKTIETWDKSHRINGESKQRTCLELKIVQGRAIVKFFPPLHELQQNELPYNLKIIPWEDNGSAIIDYKQWVMLAVRIHSSDDEHYILLPSEMIYIKNHDSALTKEEQFFGRSDMEPIIQLSRTHREAENYHAPKAIAATYLPKITIKLPVDGTPKEKDKIIADRIAQFAKEGVDIIGIESDEHSDIAVIVIKPNHEMFETTLNRIDVKLMANIRTTPARLGRTEGLTRDNATLIETIHIRDVRTPDERSMSQEFIRQLYQPLLAHLSNMPEEELPVRITITRVTPTDETINPDDPTHENLIEQKSKELSQNHIQQNDAKGPFGAAGESTKKITKKAPAIFAMLQLLLKTQQQKAAVSSLTTQQKDEIINDVLESDRVVIYHTQKDSKVDADCKEYSNKEYSITDVTRPLLPLHPNCRCYYTEKETGANLGQF